MFDKLSKLFENQPERDFKPRQQGTKAQRIQQVAQHTQIMPESDSPDGKSTLIGKDPFNKKSEIKSMDRQTKIEQIKQLMEELKKHE
jgi:hypothetical protein